MKCPVCSTEMTKSFSHSTEIDVCIEHGIWLDKGELSKITNSARLKSKGATERRAYLERENGKLQGIMWGWSALFMK